MGTMKALLWEGWLGIERVFVDMMGRIGWKWRGLVGCGLT